MVQTFLIYVVDHLYKSKAFDMGYNCKLNLDISKEYDKKDKSQSN